MLKIKTKALLVVMALCLSACCHVPEQPHKCVTPLKADYVLDSIVNDTIAASFSANDFSWARRSLTFEAFGETCYDTALVNKLAIGDTIVYESKKMAVDTIVRQKGFVEINGGVEKGGMWLSTKGGGAWPDQHRPGTYRATEMDDHSVYDPLGKATMRLSDKFFISDCGDNPGDKASITTSGHEKYMETLPDYRRDFSCLSTRIIIKDGKVNGVVRHWIP